MKYAVENGQRVAAYSHGRAKCRYCNSEVVAKCGSYRVHHWAHRGVRECDMWAEKETHWHRAWKNNFPAECQEVIQYDSQSGEKHIADVRAPHGLVIEFQHSHVDPEERVERERFHGNMVWVVDGTRLQRDYPRFKRGTVHLRATNVRGFFFLSRPDECFPTTWLNSSVPVIFDFRIEAENQPLDEFREPLWCLLPKRAEGPAVVVGMSRKEFVEVALSRRELFPVQ